MFAESWSSSFLCLWPADWEEGSSSTPELPWDTSHVAAFHLIFVSHCRSDFVVENISPSNTISEYRAFFIPSLDENRCHSYSENPPILHDCYLDIKQKCI